MIFSPDLAKLVLRGQKTETRRPIKPSESECRYRLQHSYSIQRSATDTIQGARLVVTHVEHQLLADLDLPAARAEGFRTRADFADYWMGLYEKRWPPTHDEHCPRCQGTGVIDADQVTAGITDLQECPVCDMGVVQIADEIDPDIIWQRFLVRHGNTMVWVIRFELEQDPIRLLTPSGRPHGSELGYTTERFNAIRDEPEAVDPARISKDWRTRAQAHHKASLQSTDSARLAGLRSDEERLAELRAMAAERKVDVRDDVNVIRRRMDAMERKIREKTDGRAA